MLTRCVALYQKEGLNFLQLSDLYRAVLRSLMSVPICCQRGPCAMLSTMLIEQQSGC
jgi:hypothetical protein